jgi:UDP-N-acetylglucosamine transferase subunit ALG13
MDEIAEKIEEEVIVQLGLTNYKPENVKFFKFASEKYFNKQFREARLIVSHAGVGTILTARKFKKPLLIVPRQKKYGEHIDDHQMEIAKELEGHQNIRVIYNIDDLEENLNISYENFDNIKYDNKLVISLKEYINRLK